MSEFTQEQLNLLECLGDCNTTTSDVVVYIKRGTLSMRVDKNPDGSYAVFCTDQNDTIQVEGIDKCLESAIKLAFQKYRDESSIVRQTRQFISNSEDDIRKYMESVK